MDFPVRSFTDLKRFLLLLLWLWSSNSWHNFLMWSFLSRLAFCCISLEMILYSWLLFSPASFSWRLSSDKSITSCESHGVAFFLLCVGMVFLAESIIVVFRSSHKSSGVSSATDLRSSENLFLVSTRYWSLMHPRSNLFALQTVSTLFSLTRMLVNRSWWSLPMSAPGSVFDILTDDFHRRLTKMKSIWFLVFPSGLCQV